MMNPNSYKPVPEGTMILGRDQYYSMDDYKTQLNNNVVAVGASGSGKTRGIVKPNILQMNGSFIISDPKGNLADQYGDYLKEHGYKVLEMDFIHPERSLRYNPLARCKTTSDASKLANAIVYELGMSEGKTVHSLDPFWPKSEYMLLASLIAYLQESDKYSEDEKNISLILKLIRKSKRKNSSYKFGSSSYNTELEAIMAEHADYMNGKGKESWAYNRFCDYDTSPDRTRDTINVTATADLCVYDTREIQQMMSGNDIDFKKIGQELTAVFVKVSDSDRSNDMLVNLFYTQMMNELCEYADTECADSRLPIPVQFILDDFATNARINGFENMISNIRSRGISAMLFVQSEAQLVAEFGDNAQVILDNCNTYVYLGGSNPEQAHRIAQRADKPVSKILNMPVSTCWIFRRGQEPVLCHTFDIDWFENEKGVIRDKNIPDKAA